MMMSRNIRLALSVSLFAISATAANAQATGFVGASGAAPTTSTVLGTLTEETVVTSPLVATTTSVQNQNFNSTTAATTTAVGATVNGITYAGEKTVAGTGSQAQTVTSTRVVTFDGGTPPTIVSNVTTVGDPQNVGTATVTAVSASGFIGDSELANNYQATLSTSGAVSATGSVVATENSTTVSQTGVTYAQRVGTATYNPSNGQVTVALPTAATSSTSVSAMGITTTGTVAAATGTFTTVNAGVINANVGGAAGAAAINAGNGRITNVSNGTAATDAVNLGQLNTAVAGVNTALASAVATLNGTINNVQREADAGTAVAVAMGGGYFLPGKKIALNVNYGNYRGESAIAGNIGFLVTDNFALNAGVATGLNSFGGTAFRVGGSVGF
jgi:YadA-like membrane anchor domain/Coiled stalk of trimeric autotransporter adhesin